MKDKENQEKLIDAILNAKIYTFDSPNGGWDGCCPFCGEDHSVGGPDGYISIHDIIHEKDCAYNLANKMNQENED